MTVRRIFIGDVGGGVFDVRMSRPGFDALVDDVADRRKISFAASRPSFGRVAETGTITAIDTWFPLTQVYSSPPKIVQVLNRGGRQIYGCVDRAVWGSVSTTWVRDSTIYVLVVDLTRVLLTRPVALANSTGLTPGDTVSYFVVQ